MTQVGELHSSGLCTEYGEKWADMGTKSGSMDRCTKFIRTEMGSEVWEQQLGFGYEEKSQVQLSGNSV